MDRFFTRITIIIVAFYFILSYILAQFVGVDILRYSYILLFEICVVSYTFCSGKYHCRYMRWTALAILLCDIVSHSDYYFNYIPTQWYNFVPLSILAIGVGTSIVLALRHFVMVNKLRSKRQSYGK